MTACLAPTAIVALLIHHGALLKESRTQAKAADMEWPDMVEFLFDGRADSDNLVPDNP